jgi:hypothetical protein
MSTAWPDRQTSVPAGVSAMHGDGKILRNMPTRAAVVALALAGATLAGCQSEKAVSAQPAPSSSATAGNGVAALGADEILGRAKAALTRAKSFRAEGTMVQDDQRTTIDVKVSGPDFAGSMAFAEAKVELLAVGGKQYLRPNEQFLSMSTGAEQGKFLARAIGGRWIAGAQSDQAFAEIFSVGSIEELIKPTGTLSKGEEKEVGGVPAVGLKDAGDPDSVLYVATAGEPYPVRLVGKGGSALVFSDFGKTFTDIAAPAAGQVVDLGKMAAK